MAATTVLGPLDELPASHDEPGASAALADRRFRDPAILLQLGWSPVQIGAGGTGRYPNPRPRARSPRARTSTYLAIRQAP